MTIDDSCCDEFMNGAKKSLGDVPEGLRLEAMAAYLITECHKLGTIRLHYTGREEYITPDPLASLYRSGQEYFEGAKIDPKKYLGDNPLNEQERECLDRLLKDRRIYFSAVEYMRRIGLEAPKLRACLREEEDGGRKGKKLRILPREEA
jgi:hypothetical protein